MILEGKYACYFLANPKCNLFNKFGLPASPFRTDSFPLKTRNKGWSVEPSMDARKKY